MMGSFIDLTGKKFGRLTVLNRAENGRTANKPVVRWKCICECGNRLITEGNSLRRGRTKSCGCLNQVSRLKNLKRVTHGGSQTRLYHIWAHMKQRCSNPNVERYPLYGGRGIKVCESWNKSFSAFRDWALSNGYSDSLTLDRINVDGDYEPKNCRWATMKQQQNNKQFNRNIEFNGETKTLSEWADHIGINVNTLNSRIDLYCWSVEKALTTPVIERGDALDGDRASANGF